MFLNKLISYKFFSLFARLFKIYITQRGAVQIICWIEFQFMTALYLAYFAKRSREILQYRWECNFVMSICRMIFHFPVRLIWFHRLKSPTKKNRSKHFDPTKRVGKRWLFPNKISWQDQSRVFALLIVNARIALQIKLPLSLLIWQFQLSCSVSISFADAQFFLIFALMRDN